MRGRERPASALGRATSAIASACSARTRAHTTPRPASRRRHPRACCKRISASVVPFTFAASILPSGRVAGSLG